MESLTNTRNKFTEMKKREEAKEQEEKALDLLDQVDPHFMPEPGSKYTEMQYKKQVRMHYQFHPYLLYKAG